MSEINLKKNDFIKKILNNKYAPYIFFVLTYMPFFIFCEYNVDDLSMFQPMGGFDTILEFTRERYNTWSSRNIIEVITVFFCRLPDVHIWAFVNMLVYMVFYKCLTYYFSDGSVREKWYFIIGLEFIPLGGYMETGNVTMTTTYLWTLVAALLSFVPVYKKIKGEKSNPLIWALSFVGFLYAGNMELYLMFMMILLAAMGISYYMKYKKLPFFIIPNGLIGMAEVINFLICPGNKARAGVEYGNVNPIFKFLGGFLCTLEYYMSNYIFQVFFLTFIIIMLCVFMNRFKTKSEKVAGVTILVLNIIISYGMCIFFYIDELPRPFRLFFYYEPFDKSLITVPEYLVAILLYGSIFYFFIRTFAKYRTGEMFEVRLSGARNGSAQRILKLDRNVQILIIFIFGILTRVAMGFSPTLSIDSERQSYLCSICLIIVMIQWIRYYKNNYKFTNHIFLMMALVSCLRNVCLGLNLKL